MQVGPVATGYAGAMYVAEGTRASANTELPSILELTVLQDALRQAEEKAITSLDKAVRVADNREVIQSAMAARTQLVNNTQTTRLAINAENATLRALVMSPSGHVRRALEQAERSIRDVVVLRAQLGVPVGCRSTFIKTLEDAYGGKLPRNGFARLMHAHQMTVGRLFKHAFVSNSRKENAGRRQGPRGKRDRDLKRQAAAAEGEGSDDSEDPPAATGAASSSSTGAIVGATAEAAEGEGSEEDPPAASGAASSSSGAIVVVPLPPGLG